MKAAVPAESYTLFIILHHHLQLMKAAMPAESYTLFIILHRHLDSSAMSTGSSQVGAALFPYF